MTKLFQADYITLRLLNLSPFVRRPDGRWRYGARSIADSVAQRLIASGRAVQDGGRLLPARPEGGSSRSWWGVDVQHSIFHVQLFPVSVPLLLRRSFPLHSSRSYGNQGIRHTWHHKLLLQNLQLLLLHSPYHSP